MELIRSDVGDDDETQGEVHIGPALETMFTIGKPHEMTSAEASSAIRFLRRTLQYEPSARSTISELMEDQWMKNSDVDI